MNRNVSNVTARLNVSEASSFNVDHFDLLHHYGVVVRGTRTSAVARNRGTRVMTGKHFLHKLIFCSLAHGVKHFIPVASIVRTSRRRGTEMPVASDMSRDCGLMMRSLRTTVPGVPIRTGPNRPAGCTTRLLLDHTYLRTCTCAGGTRCLSGIVACTSSIARGYSLSSGCNNLFGRASRAGTRVL